MEKQNSNPLVSIIVLNWNGLEDTKKCLKSIDNLDYNNLEVIVVDNGSSDDSKSYLKNVKNIIFVDNKVNDGFVGGNILGLQQAHGEYILLLNNDAVISSDYITIALGEFSKGTNIAAVGGKAYNWGPNQDAYDPSNSYFSYHNIDPFTAEATYLQSDSGVSQNVNSLSGSCVMIKKSVIDKLGFFYKPYFAYFEETDLFARYKRAGYKIIYSPKLVIWHKIGASSSGSFQYYQLLKNRFIFATRSFDFWHYKRFLYHYLKLSIPCLWLSFKDNNQQVMHKSYAKAFLFILVTWPYWVLSRLGIKINHPKSYNELITVEQKGLSFIVDCTKLDDKSLARTIDTATSLWQSKPQHEYVLVVNKAQKVALKENISGIFCVRDKELLDTSPLNVGWLSSVKDKIVFSKSLNNLNLASLEDASYRATRNGKKVVFFSKSKVDVADALQCESLISTCIIDRSLLTTQVGIQKDRFDDSIIRIFCYAYAGNLLSVDTLNKSDTMHSSELLSYNITNAMREEARQQYSHDKKYYKGDSWWHYYLDKHYRVSQIVATSKWLISIKIPPRLKIARVKNVFIYAATLNRKQFATELKHMRNDLLKMGWRDDKITHLQKEEIPKICDYYLEHHKDMPVFIITRDRVTDLKKLIAWLETCQMTKIIIVDNDSIYPPLKKYLEETKYQVINTRQNVGHKVMWESGIVKALAPYSFYIVSDPDILPEDSATNSIMYFMELHKKYIAYQKIGFGLRIDDLPDWFENKKTVIDWENQFWKTTLEDSVYDAGLDTTFAVYKPFNYKYFLHPSIRTGYPYIARHMPWYIDNSKELSKEELFYRLRASRDVSTWNLDSLPEKYVKELKRQGIY